MRFLPTLIHFRAWFIAQSSPADGAGLARPDGDWTSEA